MLTQRNIQQQNYKVSFLDNILPIIEKGTVYNLVTQKVINPYLFILQALKSGNIKHLYIATYAINTKAGQILFRLMDEGKIEKWTLLVNENMKYRMKGKEIWFLEEEKKRLNFRIIKKRNHSKITLIEQEGRTITISGSGNYSENPKIEQYTISADDDLFEFHKSWIEDDFI